MGRPALATEQLEEFRDALCTAALKLFAEEGYAAVTLRAVAAKVGCSHPLVYRYFADKEDLFAAVRLRCFERFSRHHSEKIANDRDPESRLRAMARNYVAFALAEPHVFRVMFDLAQPQISNRPDLRDAHRRAFRILERVVAAAITAGVLQGKARELTALFWSSIRGVAALQASGSLPKAEALVLANRATEALLYAHAPVKRRPATTRPPRTAARKPTNRRTSKSN